MIVLRNNKYLKKILILEIVTILILNLVGCSNINNEIVAKVNEEIITKDALYKILVEQGGEQLLENLINEIIINSESEKAGIVVTEKEVQAELNKMIESYGGEDAFNDVMTYYGYDMEEMMNNINMNLKIKRLLEPRLKITDEEIKEYFEENKDDYKEEEEVLASHILVEEEKLAKDIYKRVKNGEDFGELAMKYSIDGSAVDGGNLGYFARGEMVEEFEDVAFSLKIGEISEPVESEYGYHIIKVLDKMEEKEAKLEDYKDFIIDEILEDNIPYLYDDWYQEIIGDYKIENRLKN